MNFNLPEKALRSEIPVGREWDLKATFDLESARIKSWIEVEVDRAIGAPGFDLQEALSMASTVSAQIRNKFGNEGQNVSPALLNKADRGDLERGAPSSGTVFTFGFLKWISALAEIAVFVATALLGLTNFFVITVGLMLALFAWVAGLGFSRLVLDGIRNASGWLFLAMGSIGIGGLAIVRAGGPEGSGGVMLITVLLALLVAIFTALELIARTHREEALAAIYTCQRWKAAGLHITACDQGFWVALYEADLRNALRTKGQASKKDELHLREVFRPEQVGSEQETQE